MSKLKSKKLVSILVILSTLCLFLFPNPTKAIEAPTGYVMGTITGKQASYELQKYLADNNIVVDSNDEISLIENDGIELRVVTQETEDIYTVHILSGYDETNDGLVKSDVPFTINKSRSSQSFTETHKNNTITFRGTATYTVSELPFGPFGYSVGFRPMSMSFYYTQKASATVDVTRINATFRTNGLLYNMSTDEVEDYWYTYDIAYDVNNPVASRTYSKSDMLSDTYRIAFGNGDGEGPFFGYEIYFSDGSADTVDDYKLY